MSEHNDLERGPCITCGGEKNDWRHHGAGEARHAYRPAPTLQEIGAPCAHCGGLKASTVHTLGHAYEPAQQPDDLDPCPLCDDPDCTGDYSDGETCPMAFELGGITPRGVVRSVRAMEGGPGGWLVKPVPGQIVADFTEEAEARRAAAAWNATRLLTLEQIARLEEKIARGGVSV